MGDYVVSQFVREMNNKKIKLNGSKVLIMGLSFKENCSDLRNSGVSSVIKKLKKYNCELDLYDPWADAEEVKEIYNIYPKKIFRTKFLRWNNSSC